MFNARNPFRGLLSVAIVLGLTGASRLEALTISEIMYFPAGLDSRRFEYIELYNENPDPLDLSGYSICDGVAFVFPPNTWMDGHSFLVVCADEAAIRAKYGITNTVGDWPWAGESGVSLANGGEDIEICNSGGRTIARVDYNDRGKWPAGADGGGHSLELVSPYIEQDDPDSWMLSDDPEGSPGVANPCWPEVSGGSSGPTGGAVGDFHEHHDVGFPCGAGETTFNAIGGRYTITGGGEDIWANGDQFQFAYVEVRGSFDFSARIASRSWLAGQRWGKGGLMARQDLSSTSRYVFVHDNPDPDGARLARRTAHGGNNNEEPFVLAGGTHPNWYRLRRSGDTITAYHSTNGTSWTAFGNTTWDGGTDLFLGLALTSHAGCGTSTLVWDNVRITATIISTPGGDDGGDDGGDESTCTPRDPVAINEGLFRTSGERWIELYNHGGKSVSLADYYITDDKNLLTKTRLGAAVSIPPGGFISFTETELGLDFSVSMERDRIFVALVEPGGERVVDAMNFQPSHDEMSEARVPDGGELRDAADPTRDAPNRLTVNTDIVINEIMYHPIDNGRDREYLELYNRGDVTVDLTGWELTNGVQFAIPDGTSVPPGGYLVIARNPLLIRSIYGLSESECIGPLDDLALDAFGSLRDRGERVTLQDELGRTADTVRYHDGGEWPRWADGHGSSMELIDPWQDNRSGMPWDASDDSSKSEVRRYAYVGRHGGEESELHLLLLSRGITVVDNVSVLQGGATVVDSPLIESDEVWRYLKGQSAPPSTWAQPGFSDGSWASGQTGIGYGDGDDVTVLSDMQGSYMTVFCRKAFTVSDLDAIDQLVLVVTIDDGFYAYLNGVEVASHNVTSPAFDAPAATAVSNGDLVERDISAFKGLLVEGTNVLAVQVHNAGLGSSDLTFIPRLVSRTVTSGGGGTEKIVNTTFNSSTSGWMIEGTHIRSGRTTVDAIEGAGSLKIIASGRGDNKVNRIESTDTGTAAFNTGVDLLISFDAQWHVGSRTLNTHGYKHAMAKTHELAVPENLGSPGRINTVTQRLVSRDGVGNLGPVLSDLEQEPAVPIAGEDVTVTCRVSDSDGISSVRLRYSFNNPSSSPASITMAHLGDGVYSATIPGQGTDTKVVFYIEATDALGAGGRYPVDITGRSHALLVNPPSAGLNDHRYFIYRHDETRRAATPFHDYRFYMTEASEAELTNRKRLSNDLIDGTFSFGGTRTYHEAKVRFSGSPWARGSWGGSFRVVAPRGDEIHGGIRRFNLEDHHGNGTDARERVAHYLLRYNQGTSSVPYSEVQTMARWQVNDRITTVREHVWVPDTQYLGLWFDDADGDFLEMDDRFVINDAGDRTGSADGRVLYPPPSERGDGDGANKENYRWFFGLRAKNGSDDFTSFLEFCRLMDPSRTSNTEFASRVWQEVDVEEFLRIWSVRLNISDWDQWSADRGKNCYFYKEGPTGQWHILAWDMELTYETGRLDQFLIPTSPTSDFNPGNFAEVNRMFDIIDIKKKYYGILDHMVNRPGAFFTSAHLSEYMDRLAAFGMANTGIGQPGGYVDQRRDRIRARLGAASTTSFRITTNGGSDFTTEELSVTIAGSGPARICRVLVNGMDHGTVHTSMTAWRVDDIPLLPGANFLEFLGYDLDGNIDSADSITVTSLSDLDPPSLTSLDPEEAMAGTDITINGSGFVGTVNVLFGTVQSPSVTLLSSNRLRVRVPAGAGAVLVKARNPDNKESNALAFTYVEPEPEFTRGDANEDGVVDVSDAVKIVLHLFRGVLVRCEDAADADDDEQLTVTDAVRLLNYFYRGGPAPPAPYPGRGPDPSGSALGCER